MGIYTPSQHALSAKAFGPSQGVPTDARSYYYDEINFVSRPYVSFSEVFATLNTATKRKGHFPVFINFTGVVNNGVITGGTVVEYWFKDGVADTSLILKTTAASGIDDVLALGQGLTTDRTINLAAKSLTLNANDKNISSFGVKAGTTLQPYGSSGYYSTVKPRAEIYMEDSSKWLYQETNMAEFSVYYQTHQPVAPYNEASEGYLTQTMDGLRTQAYYGGNDSLIRMDVYNGNGTNPYFHVSSASGQVASPKSSFLRVDLDGIKLNTSQTLGVDNFIKLAFDGTTTITALKGTGTRMVVANDTGVVSTMALPSGGSGNLATAALSANGNYVHQWNSHPLTIKTISEAYLETTTNATGYNSYLDIYSGTSSSVDLAVYNFTTGIYNGFSADQNGISIITGTDSIKIAGLPTTTTLAAAGDSAIFIDSGAKLYTKAVSSGGTSYTFTNGLTETTGTVKLGGRLTQDTLIDGLGNRDDYATIEDWFAQMKDFNIKAANLDVETMGDWGIGGNNYAIYRTGGGPIILSHGSGSARSEFYEEGIVLRQGSAGINIRLTNGWPLFKIENLVVTPGQSTDDVLTIDSNFMVKRVPRNDYMVHIVSDSVSTNVLSSFGGLSLEAIAISATFDSGNVLTFPDVTGTLLTTADMNGYIPTAGTTALTADVTVNTATHSFVMSGLNGATSSDLIFNVDNFYTAAYGPSSSIGSLTVRDGGFRLDNRVPANSISSWFDMDSYSGETTMYVEGSSSKSLISMYQNSLFMQSLHMTFTADAPGWSTGYGSAVIRNDFLDVIYTQGAGSAGLIARPDNNDATLPRTILYASSSNTGWNSNFFVVNSIWLTPTETVLNLVGSSSLKIYNLPVYADNTAAAALATGTVYRTSTGVLMIKY